MRQETSPDGSHTLPGIVKRLALRLRLSFCKAAEAQQAAAAAAEASKQALALASSKYSATWICKRMIRLGNSHLYKAHFLTVRDVCWASVTRRNSRGGGLGDCARRLFLLWILSYVIVGARRDSPQDSLWDAMLQPVSVLRAAPFASLSSFLLVLLFFYSPILFSH